MAFRSWARFLGSTVGVGALAAAGQLGLAYGLGILRLTRVVDVTARDQWVAQLAWVAWITMTSAAFGAMAGRGALPPRSAAGTRILGAVAAAVGAAVTVPLTMQPARTAEVDGVHPVFIIGVCAALGSIAGILAAYAAISRAVARWNLTSVTVAIWVVAVVSVLPSMSPSGPLPAARLGVFDARFLPDGLPQRTALFTMPALALIIGLVVGVNARRARLSTVSVALSGLAGPALLTLAYLIAGPGSGDARYQAVPYWAAMTAAGAGVLGSVLVAVLGGGRGRPTDGAPKPPRDDSAEWPSSSEPTEAGAPPLPRRKARSSRSAIAEAAAVAAQRPEEQLRPSDTGVFTMPGETPPFDGFTPAQSRPQPQALNTPPVAPPPSNPPLRVTPAPQGGTGRGRKSQGGDGEFVDWVSGLGNG